MTFLDTRVETDLIILGQGQSIFPAVAVLELVDKERMFLNNSPQDLRTTFWQRDLYDCGQIGYIPSCIVSLTPQALESAATENFCRD